MLSGRGQHHATAEHYARGGQKSVTLDTQARDSPHALDSAQFFAYATFPI
jgi:hypothetical protein